MRPYIFLVSLTAALGGLLFGFDTAVISGVIEFIEKPEVFNLNVISKGWVVASILIGCMGGCCIAGYMGDRFGRKYSLIISAFLFLISALGCAFANNIEAFVLFRMLGGIGVGMASILSPLFISEISPANMRGRLVSVNQLTIVIGILIAYFSNYMLIDFSDNWRWMVGVMSIPAFLFLVSMFFVPESPRWLVIKNMKEKALKILVKINSDIDSSNRVLNEISDSINSDKEKGTLKDLFSKRFRKIAIIAIILAVLQQITGINSVIYYAPAIFLKAGLSTGSALLQTVVIGTVNFLFTVVAIALVDKVGRRLLMLIGVTGMGISLGLLNFSFYMNLSPYLILACILGFIASFASSIGPVMWVVVSEILPNKIRNIGVSFAVLLLWAANFILTFTFPYIFEALGGFSFGIFLFFCIVMFYFVYKYIPETKNKTLEEIEKELTK